MAVNYVLIEPSVDPDSINSAYNRPAQPVQFRSSSSYGKDSTSSSVAVLAPHVYLCVLCENSSEDSVTVASQFREVVHVRTRVRGGEKFTGVAAGPRSRHRCRETTEREAVTRR